MYRIHLDDLQYSMPAADFAALKRFFEKNADTLLVRPDDVSIPNNFMPGTFTTRHGRWDQDEPMPPYAGTRKAIEDARSGKIKPPA